MRATNDTSHTFVISVNVISYWSSGIDISIWIETRELEMSDCASFREFLPNIAFVIEKHTVTLSTISAPIEGRVFLNRVASNPFRESIEVRLENNVNRDLFVCKLRHTSVLWGDSDGGRKN